MSKIKYQSPTGMHDIYREDEKYYSLIEETAKKIADFYGFDKITTPILEEADLFIRSIGGNTDIVEKEMYTFKTKGKDFLALRPEGTAPIMRAYIEHGMQSLFQPVKLWYYGPFFRYERPQAGRFRQFFQVGFEILGDSNYIHDAQTITIGYNLLKDIGLTNLIVSINSIGCNECRKDYKKRLTSFLRKRKNDLCADCKRRSEKNVLRVLDCKKDSCKEILEDAPQILDVLCDECRVHFKSVLESLDAVGIPYQLDSFLVRGLDYYTQTVFEIKFCEDREDAVGSLLGGGRYNDLGEDLKAGSIPACGFAAGVDRIITAMRIKDIRIKRKKQKQIFIVQIGDLAKKQSLGMIEVLRKNKIGVVESLGKNSMKSQLTKANKLGIKIVLILGQREAIDKTVIIRNMETGKQVAAKQEDIIKEIKTRLK